MPDNTSPPTSRADFGQFLLAEGLLGRESLRQARENQAVVHARLDTVLLDMRLMGEETLLSALGRFHDTRTVSGGELTAAAPEVAAMVSPRMAARYEIVPYRMDGTRLLVAMLDPRDLLVQDELNLLTGCLVSARTTLELRMYEALSRLYDVKPPGALVLVARRLAAEGAERRRVRERPQEPSAPESRAPAATPAEPAPTMSPPAIQPSPAPPSRPPQPTELEITDEELTLFPSLRAQPVADTPAAGQPETPVEAPRPAAAEAPSTPPVPDTASPAQRLVLASAALQNAEMREDIADALLEFCAPYLRRRLMVVVRKDVIMGWCGGGDGVDTSAVRAISIPLAQPSVFMNLLQGQSFWLGPLPPMPRNQDLVLALGGEPPQQCLILPVTLRDKTVCFLYGDNLDEGLTGVPVAELRRLVARAGLAFQVYILKSKIRTL